jgi:hypothetical protein
MATATDKAIAADKTLKIIVHRKGSTEKIGTFTGPAPKMRIPPGYVVAFDLQVTPTDDRASFSVNFPATPFTNDDTPTGQPLLTPITDSTPHRAVIAGLFHYTISVTTADGTFAINNCPELDVDPGLH